MSSPGAVLGKVVHAGEWMEKALVRLSSIRSVSGSFKYHHVKGPQFHTIDAWQVLRRVKLPSMFTGIATVTPSADLYGLLGYTLVYL